MSSKSFSSSSPVSGAARRRRTGGARAGGAGAPLGGCSQAAAVSAGRSQTSRPTVAAGCGTRSQAGGCGGGSGSGDTWQTRGPGPKPHCNAVLRRQRWVLGAVPGADKARDIRCRSCNGPHFQRACVGWQTCAVCGAEFSGLNPGVKVPPFRRCRDCVHGVVPQGAQVRRREVAGHEATHVGEGRGAATAPTVAAPSVCAAPRVARKAPTPATAWAAVAAGGVGAGAGAGPGADVDVVLDAGASAASGAPAPAVPAWMVDVLAMETPAALVASGLVGSRLRDAFASRIELTAAAAAAAAVAVFRAAVDSRAAASKHASWSAPSQFGPVLRHVCGPRGEHAHVVLGSAMAALKDGPVAGEPSDKVLQWVFATLVNREVVSADAARSWVADHAADVAAAPALARWVQWLTQSDDDSDSDGDDDAVSVASSAAASAASATRGVAPLGVAPRAGAGAGLYKTRDLAALVEESTVAPAVPGDRSGIPDVLESWDDAMLDERLQRAVLEQGWDEPSAIQKQALPALLKGRDVLAQAQSGTGKTGFFCIGALSLVDTRRNSVQGLVLAPTMELAIQSHGVMEALATRMGVRVQLLSAASDPVADARMLRSSRKPHIVVATLGRLEKLVAMGTLDGARRSVRVVVVDEADNLLDHSAEAMKSFFRWTAGGDDMRVALVSATLTPHALSVAQKLLENPVTFTLATRDVIPACIKHFSAEVPNRGGFDAKVTWTHALLAQAAATGKQGMVFVAARVRAERLATALAELHGMRVPVLHGGTENREAILAKFAAAARGVLICTDVAARGVDVQTLGFVIQFDCAPDAQTYIHRAGRTGRFGRVGVSVTLLQSYREQQAVMADVQRHVHDAIGPLSEADVHRHFG